MTDPIISAGPERPVSPFTSVKVVDYDKSTGQILRTIHYYDPEHVGSLYPGALYLPTETDVNDLTDYVTGGQVVKRPTQKITTEGVILKGISKTATVMIEGVSYSCDGSDVHLSFSHPGKYVVTVKDWPYLDWSTEVEA